MIAKLFSRADICLVTHITHDSIRDPHFPFSEKGVIDYFERAMNTSVSQKVYRERASLLPTDRKTIQGVNGEEVDVLYTIHGMIRIANAMVDECNIPATYLRNVVGRIALQVKDDDTKYTSLKKMFTNCISHDAGYASDRRSLSDVAARTAPVSSA